jgi:hypothetical protein
LQLNPRLCGGRPRSLLKAFLRMIVCLLLLRSVTPLSYYGPPSVSSMRQPLFDLEPVGRWPRLREILSCTIQPMISPGRRISEPQKRQPEIARHLHDSIRRQLSDGVTEPLFIASEALKALDEGESPLFVNGAARGRTGGSRRIGFSLGESCRFL